MTLIARIRRTAGLLAVPFGLTVLSAGPGWAQATWAVRIKQVLAAGDSVSSADLGVVNSAGQWAVRAKTTRTDPTTDQVLLRETGLHQREGDAVSGLGAALDGFGPFDLDDSGNLFQILYLSGTGSVDDDTGIFRNGALILREGDVSTAPQFGAGTVYRGFTNLKANAAGDFLAVVAGVDDPAVPGALETAVLLLGISGGAVTSQTVIAKKSDVLPGQTQPVAGIGSGLHQLAVNAGGEVLFFADLAGSRATDGAIYRNGTLIAQEGSPAPDPGRNYERLSSRAMDLNDAGDALFQADLDAATNNDAVLVVTDSIVVRESDRPFPSPIANRQVQDFGTPDTPVRLDGGRNITFAGHAAPLFGVIFAVDTLATMAPQVPGNPPFTVDSLDVREVVTKAGSYSASRSNGHILYFARTGPSNGSVDGYALLVSTSTIPVGAEPSLVAADPLQLRVFPSPARGSVQVRFALSREEVAAINVYDVRGRRVDTLFEGVRPAGDHRVIWSRNGARGRRVTPGIYFIQLRTGDREQMARVTLIE